MKTQATDVKQKTYTVSSSRFSEMFKVKANNEQKNTEQQMHPCLDDVTFTGDEKFTIYTPSCAIGPL